MAANLPQRIKKQQETPFLEIKGFAGLSLKLAPQNRPKNTFQQLDNFDLYIPGSIRKILPAVEYGGPYGANILNCSEYLAQPNNPQGGIRRLIGVGADGNLYDLASATPATPYAITSTLLGVPSSIPIILQFPGYYIPFNIRSWFASTAYAQYDAVLEYGPDGNVYVFAILTSAGAGTSGSNEPVWPSFGTVTDGGASVPSFSATPGATTVDGTVVWTCRGTPGWAASHAYSTPGTLILDPNGNIEAVHTAGTSATHQPAWPAMLNQTTIDNSVLWRCWLKPSWAPSTAYSTYTGFPIGNAIIDPAGNIQQCTTSGISSNGAFSGITWTNVGMPNSNRFFAYFLSIVSPGVQPIRIVEWQYDPTSVIETPTITVGQMGCSPATVPPEIGGTVITPNLNGYGPVAGRAYQWTYYNPQTLQESSPSPFAGKTAIIETDNSNATVTINGSLVYPLPIPTTAAGLPGTPSSSYQIYYIAIPVSAFPPPIGQGYTTIRIYATKDGGSVFFLVTTLFDENGAQISNSDGSIPISLLTANSVANTYTDYFPLPVPQPAVPSVRAYEGSGPINLAPDPVNLGADGWSPGVGTGIYIAEGTAPDGSNSFQIDGPNTSSNTYDSSNITVSHQSYYFQMFLDKTSGTGGTMKVEIVRPSGAVLLTLTQSDGVASTLHGTFTPATVAKVIFIRVSVNGVTITSSTSLAWSDPVLQAGSSFDARPTNYPTTDSALTIPAPLAFSNNPPPVARSAELFLDAEFFVDHINPTKLWFSQQGQYEKVPSTNYVQSSTAKGPTIMQLVRVLDRLILLKERSIEQILTYPPTSPSAVDPQHGGLAYRSGVPFGVSLFALMTHGLGKLSLAAAIAESQAINTAYETILVGDDIKPIIDTFSPGELHAQNLTTTLPSPTVLNDLDLFLIAYTDVNPLDGAFNRYILARYMGTSAGFSRFIPFDPTNEALNMITVREVQAPTGGTGAWPLAGDGNAYVMALLNNATSQILFAGTQDGSITATAVTQPLPTLEDIAEALWDTQKTFRELYVDGDDIDNFQVSFSVDGGSTYPWGPFPLRQRMQIGVPGKQLTIKLTHAVASSTTPLITSLRLDYDVNAGRNQGND